MPLTPDDPFPKARGDIVRSKDWNDAVLEIQRLDNDKLNRGGDTLTGPLTVTDNLSVRQGLSVSDHAEFSSTALFSGDVQLEDNLFVAGNIGARTGSPTNSLSVSGNADISGNLGIGTATPTGKLEARVENEGELAFRLSSGSNVFWDVRPTNEGGRFQTAFNAGGNQRDFVFPASNVGVGTTTPFILGGEDRRTLHVSGSLTPAFFLEDTRSNVSWAIFTSAANGGLIISENFSNHHFAIAPGGNVGIGTTSPTATLHVQGNIRFTGSLIGGGKGGYVMDQFINNLGETLEQGDVVVISENQTSLFYEEDTNIPVGAVNLAQRAYDTRVCGVVCEIYTEERVEVKTDEAVTGMEPERPRRGRRAAATPARSPVRAQAFSREELGSLDRTRISPGQVGWMVTLGMFAYCKVDADIAPVAVGDLLTTSPTRGHAQKVLEPQRAVGAILGKAMQPLRRGREKIPVLVMLQ